MSFPSFSVGEVLTAADMNAVGLWKIIPTVSGTGFTVDGNGRVTISGGTTTGGYILNCFSTNFRNYRMVVTNATGSTSGYIAFRLSVGTTPNQTASSYTRTQVGIAFGGAATGSTEQNTFYYLGNTTTTSSLSSTVEFYQPQIATPTNFATTFTQADATTNTGGGRHNQSTAYDSLQLFCSTGTFNATVDIYGYRN